jgi:predicted Rossmann fold flavoprotein
MSKSTADLVVVGAGAAGLTAAIWAHRTSPSARIVVLDGAQRLGAKILVSGGGRCNVTHDVVDESAYAGSSRNAIKKVLRRFDVPQTVAFFRELGVELKREETGKLFPITDSAKTVLNAMLSGLNGVDLRYPRRVSAITRDDQGFLVGGEWGEIRSRSVILATGGKSLPKTGSDGGGYVLARSLGHTITPRVFPALVPLIVREGHFIRALSGLTLPTTLELRSGTGKRLITFTGSTLCTHFGLSGPAVLDMSRYYHDAVCDDPAAHLVINWTVDRKPDELDKALITRDSLLRALPLPERLIRTLCAELGIEPGTPGDRLTRDQRRAISSAAADMRLPITGDRGFNYAEVTAGGVPLSEIRLETMESRVCTGLHLCGELCDVDGRIGGYNFQWAWASGYVAGISAVI